MQTSGIYVNKSANLCFLSQLISRKIKNIIENKNTIQEIRHLGFTCLSLLRITKN